MRKVILLLAGMLVAALVTGGAALAAGQLDQQTNTGSGVGLDRTFQQAQAFTVGSPGSLDSSGLLSGTALASGSVPVGNFTRPGSGDRE